MTRAEAIEQAARALVEEWETASVTDEMVGMRKLRAALALPVDAPSTVTRAVDAAILAHREARASVALDGETQSVDEEGP